MTSSSSLPHLRAGRRRRRKDVVAKRTTVTHTDTPDETVVEKTETTTTVPEDPAVVEARRIRRLRRRKAEAERLKSAATAGVAEAVTNEQLDELASRPSTTARVRRKVRQVVEELVQSTKHYSTSVWAGLRQRGGRISARSRELRQKISAHPAVQRVRVTTDKTITGALGLVSGAAAVVVYTATGVVYLGAAGTAMLIVGGVCLAVWGIQAVGVVGSYVLATAEVGVAAVNDVIANIGSYVGLSIPNWDSWSLLGS